MPHDNKTEQPTPRRRQKAREKGRVVRSRELIASLATVTAVMVVAAQAPDFVREWRGLLRHALAASVSGDLHIGTPLLAASGLAVTRTTLVAIGLAWMAAAVGALAQGGLVFAPAALAPRLSHLSPAARLQQLFSLPALGRLLKSLLPAAAVIYLAVAVLARDWDAILTLPAQGISHLAGFTLGHVFEIAWKSALVLLVWSGVDYLLERHKLESDLRMSRQEVLDEYKETEGHPTVKARIRRLQRQLRRRRMLEEVKRASVVITNPTEFAVALEYRAEMMAPVVVAKGRNLLARQIKQLARWHGIPQVENPPLAHALYRAVEIGQAIPPKLYAVVAGILAALYRAQVRATQAASRAGGR